MTHDTLPSLEELLSTPPAELLAGRNAVAELVARPEDPIVLFGAGRLGRCVLGGLRKAGREVLGFADNAPALWGRSVDGLAVLPPDAAVRSFGRGALFVVTVYNGSPVLRQLRAAGVRVLPFPTFAWANPKGLLPHYALAFPHEIARERDAIRHARDLWADEESRDEFERQVAWRLTLDAGLLRPPRPADETYFPPDLLPARGDELFVDCGAYDGDSIRAFLERRGTSFRKIVAIEADRENASRLTAWAASLAFDIGSRVTIHSCAVGAEDGTIFLDGSGAQAARSEDGVEVPCRTLDGLLSDEMPTLLKMDIEGAEADALLGARGTLSRCRPALAVSLYHRPCDLWTLPLLIRSLEPSYRLYLRRYAEDCWEQVCYAVPEPTLLPIRLRD